MKKNSSPKTSEAYSLAWVKVKAHGNVKWGEKNGVLEMKDLTREPFMQIMPVNGEVLTRFGMFKSWADGERLSGKSSEGSTGLF